ncbi:hypothetical protein GCM10010377_48330 [Streptomyces viridiviolaceus]|nr:hypothetical protein GCM10010377_48330 [Streptomyces viridiviolaceus]
MGRLLTDETLTSVHDERIVAVGDAAAPSDRRSSARTRTAPRRGSTSAAGQAGAKLRALSCQFSARPPADDVRKPGFARLAQARQAPATAAGPARRCVGHR